MGKINFKWVHKETKVKNKYKHNHMEESNDNCIKHFDRPPHVQA